jgi:hypothetical protein
MAAVMTIAEIVRILCILKICQALSDNLGQIIIVKTIFFNEMVCLYVSRGMDLRKLGESSAFRTHHQGCCIEKLSPSDMLTRLSYLRPMNDFKHSSYTAIVPSLFGADGRLSTLAYINANLLSILRTLL